MTPDPHTPPELAELAAAACDGSITPEEVAALEKLIVENGDARTAYSQRCEFDADLRLYWHSNIALETALASVEQTAIGDHVSHAVRDKQPQPVELERASESSRACEDSEPNAIPLRAAREGEGVSLAAR